MALQEASGVKVSRAKIGGLGKPKSGKTTTLSLLSIGISKEFHQNAPVAFYSTEPGVDFVMPFFEQEGVKLYVDRSKAFSDLVAAVNSAIRLGCCALVVDSITHVWVELVDAYCRRRNIEKPEFHHWKDIKGMWAEWADLFVNAPLHILVAGRAGYEYEYQEDERGKKELVKGDSKMKAEGDFGYEADLLLEMSSIIDKQELAAFRRAAGNRKKGQPSEAPPRSIHTALVKGCRVWALNGKQFSWPGRDTYQVGDYKQVLEPFLPYFQFLKLGQVHVGIDPSRKSDDLFARNNRNDWYKERDQKAIAIEDWEATMELIYPGSSAEAKKMRAVVGEAITGVRSRTQFESLSLPRLQECSKLLRNFEQRAKAEGVPKTEEGSLTFVDLAKKVLAEDQLEITAEDAAAVQGQPF